MRDKSELIEQLHALKNKVITLEVKGMDRTKAEEANLPILQAELKMLEWVLCWNWK